MALSDISSELFAIQSKRGTPLRTLLKDNIRQNLQSKVIVYRLVKTITRSGTLASIAESKFGLFKPKEQKEKVNNEEKFKGYTVASIGQLQKQINTLAAATEKNTALINSLFLDLGYYRGSRRINPLTSTVSLTSVRIPLRDKTVKGKIDQINAQLQVIKNGPFGAGKKTYSEDETTTKRKNLEKSISNGLKGGLIAAGLYGLYELSRKGGLSKSQSAMVSSAIAAAASATIRQGVKVAVKSAVPVVGTYFAGKAALSGIANAEERAKRRSMGLSGINMENNYEPGSVEYMIKDGLNQVLEEVSAKYDPVLEALEAAVLGYTAIKIGSLGFKGYKYFRGKSVSRNITALRATAAASKAARAAEAAKEIERAQVLRDRALGAAGGKAKSGSSFMRRLAATRAASPVTATSAGRDAARDAAREARRAGVSPSRERMTALKSRVNDTIRKVPYSDRITKIGAWLSKSKIVQKLSPLLIADLVYQYTQMRSLNNEFRSGKSDMTYDEYKKNMIGLLGGFTNTLGASGAGALVGAILGETVFPPGGGIVGAAAGVVAGGAASIAASMFMEGSTAEGWMATKLFSLLFEGDKLEPIPSNAPGIAEMGSTDRSRPAPNANMMGWAQERTKNEPDFIKEVQRVSDKFQINPADLLSVMYIETGGTLSPSIKNPNGSATGLIQFTETTAKTLGTTTAALANMTRAQQMKYVEKYFDYWKLPKGASRGQIYSYVFVPGRAQKGMNVLATKNDPNPEVAKWYDQNKGLDVNRDGVITVDDLSAKTGGISVGSSMVASATPVVPEHQINFMAEMAARGGSVLQPPVADTVAAVDNKSENAQINAIAALQSVSRVQQQVNAVATETVRLQQQAKQQEDFPPTSNRDMEAYA